MARDNEGSSPYRRHQKDIEESRSSRSVEDDDESLDPFDISSTKSASNDRLKRWRAPRRVGQLAQGFKAAPCSRRGSNPRHLVKGGGAPSAPPHPWQAALVQNASRRFRYTLDLKKEEEKQATMRKLREHAQAIRAAYLFANAGERIAPTPAPRPIPTTGYGIGPEQLASMTRDQDVFTLQNYGGVEGLAVMLKTDAEKGILSEEANILHRQNVFGSNIYPKKKEKIFWSFLWDACQDTFLIILMVAAVASLGLGIKRKVSLAELEI